MIRFAFILLPFLASAQQFVMSTYAGGSPPATPTAANGVSIGDPARVAVDAAGGIYFGSLHSIFRVDSNGALVRLAGVGRAGVTGDNGLAISAQLNQPLGIVVDPSGVIYFLDGNSIRKIAVSTITTLPVDGLSNPIGLTIDQTGNLYVADTGNNVVRKIAPDGGVSTVAGNGTPAFRGDGGAATSASLNGPEGVALDSNGNLYIADTFNHRIRRVSKDGLITTFAGNGSPAFSGDDAAATAASMVLPTDVAVDRAGNVYIADLGNSRIRKVGANGVISTIAGSDTGQPPTNGSKANTVRLSGPTGLAVDPSGAIYIAEGSVGSGSGLDGGGFTIWKVTPDGNIAAAAGVGLRSFSGDNGPAALAQFNAPAGLALDPKGNLYVADSRNNRIRRISAEGIVTTIAGNALGGFSGDGGPAVAAQLNRPTGVALDTAGNLYIADSGNNRVRMVFPNGIIGTLAGNGNAAFFGDGGKSDLAALNKPEGVAVDSIGAVYIADTANHVIRRVYSGVIDSVVSGGLVTPTGVAVADDGGIYVADQGANVVRRFSNNATTTTPLPGAHGLAIDANQNVYATGSNRVVRVLGDGSSITIAGTGACCYAGDGGPAGAALLNAPWGITADPSGSLYIADAGNDAIRLATATPSTFFVRAVANAASNQVGPVAPGELVTIYGAGLGPATLAVADLTAPLPTALAGTSVTFNGVAAPILYASAGQVSALVPSTITGQTADAVVRFNNGATQSFPLQLAGQSPGLFTADSSGVGQARALNSDGSANSPSRPALDATLLTLFATGINGDVNVTIGGKPAAVQSVASIGPGVSQIVVLTPTGVTGQASVVLRVGNSASQTGVTVSVQ